ncbi:MAG: pantetheine-phosphate adenylyltransferase [Proteobacteria bacterium]|nr:MAG: pantetheine-phosphate adenylyltransferase [Pseudomonadota bacterium]
MYKKVVYPGTFDPITNGHLDIIKRAHEIFGNVIVAVSKSHGKNPCFDLEKRIFMVKEATKDLKNVSVIGFDNLLVDFAKGHNAHIIIRGLRAVSDFEFELQMGYANSSLWEKIETIYLMPSLENAFISSSVVRSILKHKGNVSHLVPKEILSYLGHDKCM